MKNEKKQKQIIVIIVTDRTDRPDKHKGLTKAGGDMSGNMTWNRSIK